MRRNALFVHSSVGSPYIICADFRNALRHIQAQIFIIQIFPSHTYNLCYDERQLSGINSGYRLAAYGRTRRSIAKTKRQLLYAQSADGLTSSGRRRSVHVAAMLSMSAESGIKTHRNRCPRSSGMSVNIRMDTHQQTGRGPRVLGSLHDGWDLG